jgi:phage virion morphogenesis protein
MAVSIKIQGINDARNKIAKLATVAGDLAPIMQEISLYLDAVNKKRYQDQVSPEGTAWRPLSPVTIARRKNKAGDPGRILIDTGRLFGSIKPSHNNRQAKVSSGPLVYAGVHQIGTAKTPARPYIGINNDELQDILRLIDKRLEAAFK